MSEEPYITMADLRAAGYCSSGIRDFCRKHDLNYQALLTRGIRCDVAEATGDVMVTKIIERLRDGR